MNDLPLLEHALYQRQDGGHRLLARSPGFGDEWQAEAERLCAGFGDRPESVPCPECVFARPLGKPHVAIVRVADQGQAESGQPGPLGFHVVVLPANLYDHLGGDPFALADRLPSPWGGRDLLTPLTCPTPTPEQRPLAEIRKVLDVPNSATLLGATQALLDGGKVVFERSAPDGATLRSLWMLLPTTTRKDLWPASFAFSNALEFDVLVVPRLDPSMFSGYLLEERAGDYPEGHYELALQTAVEAGDQRQLDTLFARRSSRQTKKLGLILLLLFLLPLVIALLKGDDSPKFELPQGEPRVLNAAETRSLTARLRELSHRLEAKPTPSVPGAMLKLGAIGPWPGPFRAAAILSLDRAEVPTELLNDLDLHLGTPHPKRAGRELWRLGSAERQLRGLLFKHAIHRYNDPDLTPLEMVDLLEKKVFKERLCRTKSRPAQPDLQ